MKLYLGNFQQIINFAMKNFNTIPEAFEWWIKNVYPFLPAETKKGRLTNSWRDYTHKGSISEKRMKDILLEFGNFEIKTIITYKPE